MTCRVPGYSFALLIKSPSLATQPFSFNSATFYVRLRLRTAPSTFRTPSIRPSLLTACPSLWLTHCVCFINPQKSGTLCVISCFFFVLSCRSAMFLQVIEEIIYVLFTVCSDNLLSHFRLVVADPHEHLSPSPIEIQLGKWKCLQEVIHLLPWLRRMRHTSHYPQIYYLLCIFVGNVGKSARNSRCGPHLVYKSWRTCCQRFVLWRNHMHPWGSVRLQVHDVPCCCVSLKI